MISNPIPLFMLLLLIVYRQRFLRFLAKNGYKNPHVNFPLCVWCNWYPNEGESLQNVFTLSAALCEVKAGAATLLCISLVRLYESDLLVSLFLHF
jgi:hypothetical protein